MKAIQTAILVFTTSAMPILANITTSEVTYSAGNVTAHGFLARPDIWESCPAVLVVHEWWGLNDYAKSRAKMLAEMGYIALAIDMYGDGKTAEHPSDAMGFMNAVIENMPEARKRFEAAMAFLKDQPGVNPDQIAAIGYCFGGGLVLQMAAEGVEGLAGVASFHGSPGAVIPEGIHPKTPMLVLHGESDAMTPMEAIEDFKTRMTAGGVPHRVVTYPGAKHGFTNPAADTNAEKYNLPLGYQKEADEASWSELQTFLKSVF